MYLFGLNDKEKKCVLLFRMHVAGNAIKRPLTDCLSYMLTISKLMHTF